MVEVTALPVVALEQLGRRVDDVTTAPLSLPVAIQELAPAQAVTWPPPLCLLGPASERQRQLLASPPRRCPAALAARVTNCRVVGRGLLVDPRDRLLVSQQIHGFPGPGAPRYDDRIWSWLEPDLPRPPGVVARRDLTALGPRAVPGRSLLLAQPGDGVFGHWLLEVLPRLALAQRLGLGALPLLLPQTLPDFAAECLALLGIPPSQVLTYDLHRTLLRPDELYIVSRLNFGAVASPLAREVYRGIAERAPGRSTGHAWRRLFLSRSRLAAGKRQVNYPELRPLLARHGFTELCPETLPLREQVSLLREASHVVAEDGSAAHLMAFSPPGLRALVLLGVDRSPELHAALAQVSGHRVGYVVGEALPSSHANHADCRIDPRLLEQALALLIAVA